MEADGTIGLDGILYERSLNRTHIREIEFTRFSVKILHLGKTELDRDIHSARLTEDMGAVHRPR